MGIEVYLKEKRDLVNKFLKDLFNHLEYPCATLKETCEYVIFSNGKRLRPILVIASFEIFSSEITKVLPSACAVELIHNYSLIHDDLPCMDNDDFRRGIPTCHRKFSEALAVLTGDALLTLAFQIVSESVTKQENNSNNILRVIMELSKSAGIQGMVGGQCMDVTPQYNKETLEKLYSLKTGALITASVKIGGILGRASKEELEVLENYGKRLGVVYQIIDDLLDKGTENKGILMFYSEEEARTLAWKLTAEAISAISIFGDKSIHLKELAQYLCKRSY